MSGDPQVTHGRHCTCAACAREDWTRITAPCGMHGEDCPAVYAPIAGASMSGDRNDCCDKCGTPKQLWDVTPCVRSLTQSPRHSVTRFFIPMPMPAPTQNRPGPGRA